MERSVVERSVTEWGSDDVEVESTELSRQHGAGGLNRGLHFREFQRGPMRLGTLPQLDDEDSVGLFIIDADLVAETADARQMIAARGQMLNQGVTLSGSNPKGACIREDHAADNTNSSDLRHCRLPGWAASELCHN